MIVEGIRQAVSGKDLTQKQTMLIMEQIMDGRATAAQIASWLTAMRQKQETITEITACVKVMRHTCLQLPRNSGMEVLDIVGTGGDELSTFNISTVTSIVLAACGIPVAKHGNRSVSSKCGSADVLEALGAKIKLTASESAAILAQTNFCFMYAKIYHEALKYVSPVRKELGIRTLFNIIGPLANPAGATHQLIGVYDEKLVEPLAHVLRNLGVKQALVVHGAEGLDEISICDSTTMCRVSHGKVQKFVITPEDFHFPRYDLAEIVGGDPHDNALIVQDILQGKKGAKRDIVVLNAAFCVQMFREHQTIAQSIRTIEMVLDSGIALQKLNEFIELTHTISQHPNTVRPIFT